LVYEKKDTAKANQINGVIEKNIWNVEGIPQYIKSYIDEIKNFKGGFIDVFKEAR